MAKKQKPQTEKAAAKRTLEEISDDQLQALFFQHKKTYERLLGAKKKADADFKNGCKLAKAELGKEAVTDIKTAIRLETDEGEAEIKTELLNAVRVARWMGAAIGSQFEMFTDTDRTPAVDRAYEHGKRDCFDNKPRKCDYAPSTPQYASYMEGYDAGQAVLANGFKATPAPKDEAEPEGEPPAGIPRDEWKKQMRDLGAKKIGDAPPTHTVTS